MKQGGARRSTHDGWVPARWATSQRPTTLLVVRLLILVNALLLTTIGALYLVFASRPEGFIVTAIAWGTVAVLVALIPYTNPRRHDRSRW